MSLMPTMRRFVDRFGAAIFDVADRHPLGVAQCDRPDLTTERLLTLEIVTLFATTSIGSVTEYPEKVAPAPSMLTQPRVS